MRGSVLELQGAAAVPRSRVCLLGASICVVFACASPPEPGQLLPSKHAVHELAASFADDLRWGRYDRALRLVHPDERAAFRAFLRDAGTRVRFTSFEIDRVERGEALNEALARVTFTLYRLPRIEEETLVDVQRWRYDHGWYLMPDLDLYAGAPREQSQSPAAPAW